jgi:Ser/Thr protein kinase RdoA (MazF antagonist)
MPNDEFWARAAEVNEQFRPVKLTAETVTRRAGPQTRTVHSFLRHLREQGLECVPEPLSLDGDTETLRYIDGESGGDGWRHQHAERGLRSAARLLRRIHDASADWQPPDDAVFDAPPTNSPGEVYCHGDPGPWNFVWRKGEAIALLDWDFLHPAPRLDDVAYALLWFAPLRDDEACLEWHHFTEVPDRRARISAFLDAYGMAPQPWSTSGPSRTRELSHSAPGSLRAAWRRRGLRFAGSRGTDLSSRYDDRRSALRQRPAVAQNACHR